MKLTQQQRDNRDRWMRGVLLSRLLAGFVEVKDSPRTGHFQRLPLLCEKNPQ
jgi:hypothetical protein